MNVKYKISDVNKVFEKEYEGKLRDALKHGQNMANEIQDKVCFYVNDKPIIIFSPKFGGNK